MLTLNQLKELLKGFFENHSMINSVYYLSNFDFSAERNISYPVVNINYLSTNMAKKTFNHNYKITIADVCESDNYDMEDDIHSDSLQVAEDFFTYLQNYTGLTLKRASTITKFVDDKGDRTSGIVFTLTLEVIRPMNWCNTPQIVPNITPIQPFNND